MKIRLSKNSYVRCSSEYGYLYNDDNHKNRVYDGIGADFLRYLKHDYQDSSVIVNQLLMLYDIDKTTLETDFSNFINELIDDSFIDVQILNEDAEIVTDNKEFQRAYVYDGSKYVLEELTIELTGLCNERCVHCYLPTELRRDSTQLPKEKIESLITEFIRLGGKRISLTGGEAFLYNDIWEILGYCDSKGLDISIMSNLIALKDEEICKLSKYSSLSIQTSLYSVRPMVHNSITKVARSCEKTLAAIDKLTKCEIPITISCPLMKNNYLYFTEVLSYARERNLNVRTDYVLLAGSDMTTDNLSNRLTIDEVESLLREVTKYFPEYSKQLLLKNQDVMDENYSLINYLNSPLCNAARNMLYVDSKGYAIICPAWGSYKIGNIYQQTLDNIWESASLGEIRSVRERTFPQCVNCEASNYCIRCLCRNYNENGGDMYCISKHFCEVAFLNKRIYEENFVG